MSATDKGLWLSLAVIVAISDSALADTITIYGNEHGLWSPTHPELTGLKSTRPLPPVAVPVPVAEVEKPEAEISTVMIEPRPVIDSNAPTAPDVCFIPGHKPTFC